MKNEVTNLKQFKSSEKGFSLIELMIVVAIIGILSAIAVPNFERFKAKSRQAEAKGNLAGVYTAQSAAFAEFGFYPGNFVAIGYRAEGALNYRISVADGTNPPGGFPNMNGCANTSVDCTGVVPNGFGVANTWAEDATTAMSGPDVPTVAPTNGPATTPPTWTAVASGRIGTLTIDEWTVDQNRIMLNVVNGSP